jgi:two-component system chemotaxis response regulator CheB
MFESVARLKRPMTGVILTGMGRDGAKGLLAMRQAGGRTLGQDEATCVVYGMPKAAYEIGAVERQLPLHRLSTAILELCADPAARSVA